VRPLPVEIEGRLQYEVESVDGERNNADGDTEYLIRWKGYGMTERTWEPLANLEHAGEAVATWNAGRVDGNSTRPIKKPPTAKARAAPTRSSPRRSSRRSPP
jgi:chromodomain protein Y